MVVKLIRLPPGAPFVLSGQIYYREFVYKLSRIELIKCYCVKNGLVNFRLPDFFPPDLDVEVYEFKSKEPN